MIKVSVIILTQNEEDNIKHTLSSVSQYFDQIIVVDSFSKDSTVDIIKSFDKVQLYQNHFDSWADQRNWIISNADIKNEYIFFVDADELVTSEFCFELSELLKFGSPDQIYVSFDYIFMGKKIKYSYGHPKIRRIFKSNKAQFIPSGAREYVIDSGEIGVIKSKLIHYDRKPLLQYFTKQLNNALRESNAIESIKIPENISTKLKFKLFIRKYIWNRLNGLIKYPLYFLYRYFWKKGFLDGFPGFVYIFMFSIWYQFMIEIFYYDKKIKRFHLNMNNNLTKN
jgi:glycosyltransferase involved in cell wall biosynthesis